MTGQVISLAERRASVVEKPKQTVVAGTAEIIDWLKPAGDWQTGMMQVELAKHVMLAADYRRIVARLMCGNDSRDHAEARLAYEAAQEEYRKVSLAQIFIPAPDVRRLRWKQKWARMYARGIRPVALAILRDKRALAKRLAVVRRQQAGRKAARRI